MAPALVNKILLEHNQLHWLRYCPKTENLLGDSTNLNVWMVRLNLKCILGNFWTYNPWIFLMFFLLVFGAYQQCWWLILDFLFREHSYQCSENYYGAQDQIQVCHTHAKQALYSLDYNLDPVLEFFTKGNISLVSFLGLIHSTCLKLCTFWLISSHLLWLLPISALSLTCLDLQISEFVVFIFLFLVYST